MGPTMRWSGQGIARRMGLLSILVGVVALAALPSSVGCSSKSAEEAKKELEKVKKKEKPKPPFSPLQVVTEPNDKVFVERKEANKDADQDDEKAKARQLDKEPDVDEIVSRLIKPGHWTGVLVTTTANLYDFSGELNSAALDNLQHPIDLEGGPFQLTTARSAALPKGQRKTMEALFFAPPNGSRTSTWMSNQLRNRQRGGEEWRGSELLQHMPSYQYFLFVLARDSNRYRYLKVLDCVRPPLDVPFVLAEDVNYYRVFTPRPNPPLALPTRSLCWTSMAYLVWDDVLPSVLSPDQQQAMLDWLHWGGGLIVSGPQTLDAMRGTFLEPYLPATAVETVKLDAASLAELNAHWTLPNGAGSKSELKLGDPWSGIKLSRHPAAEFLPGTGELVAERRVGRGRIVVTAFRLNERELLNWRSFDSFFNGALLRRPPRGFDSVHQQFSFVKNGHKPARDRFDPEVVTGVRYFSRDLKEPNPLTAELQKKEADSAVPTAPATPRPPPAQLPPGVVAQVGVTYPYTSESDSMELAKTQAGVAAWNDFSAVSKAARQTLREAAGISVPKREFVLWMIGIYLVLLVPVNWLLFRLLGRVEWAWFAVPVVAVVWGVAVIWLAQLDIGFARAETEVAVLEAQKGFSRAHLTRYTALYSSLSTTYDVHYDDPQALAQPFSVDVGLLHGQGRSTVALRNLGDNQLDDFGVSSNSTGMVHSEQMFSLGGTIDWQTPADEAPMLENNTKLKLSGVLLIRRRVEPGSDKLIDESAWVGDLAAGSKAVPQFQPHQTVELAIEEAREQSPLTTTKPAEGSLSLRHLTGLAENHSTLNSGDVRMIGWRDSGLAGVNVEPSASQARRATLVVANLAFGAEPATPDRNLRVAVQPSETE